MSILEDLRSDKAKILRKIILLLVAFIFVLALVPLFFLPYCSYKLVRYSEFFTQVEQGVLQPYNSFLLVKNILAKKDGVAYCGVALTIVVIVLILFALFLFIRCVIKFFRGEKDLMRATKIVMVYVTLVAAIYPLSGVFLSLIMQMNGGNAGVIFYGFIPLAAVAILDLLFSIYTNILFFRGDFLAKKDQNEIDAEFERKKINKIYFARLELIIFAVILFAVAMVTMLSSILKVEFESEYIEVLHISGLKIISRFATLEKGGQILAFILTILLTVVCTMFFLMLVTFLSRSKLFYKFSLASIVSCVVSCFLVGMFANYYKIVQTINHEMIVKAVESMISMDITEELKFKVYSNSFYYFLGAIAVLTVLIVRRPYSRGLETEEKLSSMKSVQIVKGDLSIKDGISIKDGGVSITDGGVSINDGVSIKDLPENLPEFPISGAGLSAEEDNVGPEFIEQPKLLNEDPCPAFTEIDRKLPLYQAQFNNKMEQAFSNPTLPEFVRFIVDYAKNSRLHLSYSVQDIAAFVAGLGTTKLTILQGMSGTGKTSLPKIFTEAINAQCEIIEVESSWRDKNELLGYYNEFSKMYTPKKFTQALYKAKLNPQVPTIIVLDEMNLSRIEYYFSDFLSLMENEPEKREINLLNVGLYRTENGEKVAYNGLIDGHTLKIPSNIWFVGTANRDESTFEISDKVYDRAHTMNFNKRAPKVTDFSEPISPKFVCLSDFYNLLESAKNSFEFDFENYTVISQIEELLAPYNISFGNRIAMQIENFVKVYCSCFDKPEKMIHEAVETILLSKVVSKLEFKSIDNKDLLAGEFAKLNLNKCSDFILKLNED